MIQNNLGNVYMDLPKGDKMIDIKQAIAYYQEALRVCAQKGWPREYAMFKKNLHIALLKREHLVKRELRTESTSKVAAAPQTITWLHLSDLHFCESCNYNETIVLKELLRDVADLISEKRLRPDFIIVSGDIASASRPEEYALARKFLEELSEITALPETRLFLVPGNHDVDRTVVGPLVNGATAVLTNRDAVNRFLVNDRECALVFSCFHNYQDFINDYLGKEHTPFDHLHYFYVKPIKINDRRVVILGLNSAWLATSDKDRHQLLLGERQVRTALDMAEGADLLLAVMHHPLEWLQDFDSKDVERLLCGRCHFVLHGHMHQVGVLQTYAPDTATMIIGAGACYESRPYPNSYNFVQIDTVTGEGKIYLRRYSDQGGFWTKDAMTYRNVRDGEYAFVLRSSQPRLN
jgi:predicted MPP superfamily phosphohydrolase